MSSYFYTKTPGDTGWFVNDRFGMFIHFGIYAIHSKGEWGRYTKKISDRYNKFFEVFDPDLMDARDWARQAKAAGMKYAVLTTKHHDGFCLFDSKYTEFKSTNAPCGRDLVREFVDAFRAEGLKVGLYYSLIDWEHPQFPIDMIHPLHHEPNAEELDKGRDMAKYREYLFNQVRELLTNYGKIDIMYFDYSYYPPDDAPAWMQFGGGKSKNEWDSENLLKLVRELQPGIIINNRLHIEQDFTTPEQSDPVQNIFNAETGEMKVWETCQTFSGAWGYNRDESSWKSSKTILDMLIRTVAKGGNTIMNVGPTARGEFDYRAQERLQDYAKWMKYNSRSIYGCTMAEPGISADEGIEITQSFDGKRLYIHILEATHKRISLRGVELEDIKFMQLLQDGTEILFAKGSEGDGTGIIYGKRIEVKLPDCLFQMTNPVIEVLLK